MIRAFAAAAGPAAASVPAATASATAAALDAGTPLSPAATLTIAAVCLILALAAVVAELTLVTFGLLALVAAALAVTSLVLAFSVSAGAGLAFLLLASVGLLFALRWGGELLRRSPWVPKAELTADAGYHHATQALGIGPGSDGVLVTPASPTGRARFTTPGGSAECDVQCTAACERGQRVRVVRVEGAMVIADPISTPPAGP